MTLLATAQRVRLQDVCRRIALLSGWPVELNLGNEIINKRSSEVCWRGVITDGGDQVGLILLRTPTNSNPRSDFQTVSGLLSAICEWANEEISTSLALNSREREIATLIDVGMHSKSESDLPKVLSKLLEAAVLLTGYRSAGFYLLNPSTNQLRLRALYRLGSEESPPSVRDLATSRADLHAFLKGPTLIHRDVSTVEVLPAGASTGMCAAVQSDSVPMGTLWVYDRRSRAYRNEEARLLKSISHQVGQILERVVLLRESAAQHRITNELKVVSENQAVAIPRAVLENPVLDVAARCVSRHELGGDLCELISHTPSSIGIAIGDASGNSIPAAMVMTTVRGALRASSGRHGAHEWHPALTMERLNEALHAISTTGQFMSLIYAVLDTDALQMTYTNAGHPVPLLFRDGEVVELHAHGLLLGIDTGISYGFSTLDLQPGDWLVFFSDGILEAMDAEGDQFGDERVIEVFRSSARQSANDLLNEIWNQVDRHMVKTAGDDRTLLVMRVRSP